MPARFLPGQGDDAVLELPELSPGGLGRLPRRELADLDEVNRLTISPAIEDHANRPRSIRRRPLTQFGDESIRVGALAEGARLDGEARPSQLAMGVAADLAAAFARGDDQLRSRADGIARGAERHPRLVRCSRRLVSGEQLRGFTEVDCGLARSIAIHLDRAEHCAGATGGLPMWRRGRGPESSFGVVEPPESVGGQPAGVRRLPANDDIAALLCGIGVLERPLEFSAAIGSLGAFELGDRWRALAPEEEHRRDHHLRQNERDKRSKRRSIGPRSAAQEVGGIGEMHRCPYRTANGVAFGCGPFPLRT